MCDWHLISKVPISIYCIKMFPPLILMLKMVLIYLQVHNMPMTCILIGHPCRVAPVHNNYLPSLLVGITELLLKRPTWGILCSQMKKVWLTGISAHCQVYRPSRLTPLLCTQQLAVLWLAAMHHGWTAQHAGMSGWLPLGGGHVCC